MFGRKTKSMTANAIAERLQVATQLADFETLIAAIGERREAIRAREYEIGSDNPNFHTPARIAAIAKGPQAVLEIDKELERIMFEAHYLERLEALVYRGREEADTKLASDKIPAAVARLAKEADGVRAALRALDAALATLSQTVGEIGAYDKAGIDMPLSETDLRALVALREEVWKIRHVSILTPAPSRDGDDWERDWWWTKWPELYQWNAGRGSWSLRPAPQPAPEPTSFDPHAHERLRRPSTRWVDGAGSQS